MNWTGKTGTSCPKNRRRTGNPDGKGKEMPEIDATNPLWNDHSYCRNAVMDEGRLLRYVRDQDDELCMLAVQNDPMALEFVKKQSPKLCRMAVENNPRALKFVRQQSEFLCRLALRRDVMAADYIAGEYRYLLTESEEAYDYGED